MRAVREVGSWLVGRGVLPARCTGGAWSDPPPRRYGSIARSALLLSLLGLAACEARPTQPAISGPEELPDDATLGDALPLAFLECVGSLTDLEIVCAVPDGGASGGGLGAALIVGGQGEYVELTSSNVAYNGGTGQFTFDVTISNLIEQPLGTADGTNLDPNGVRVFFHTGPEVTGGTGTASVVPDGFGTFTATGQPYYQYDEIIQPEETSSAKGWTLIVSPTVSTFAFTVYVAAEVPYPNGYIDLGDPIGLQVTDELTVASTLKSAVGNALPGPGSVAYESSDTDIATVDGDGVVTGVAMGTVTITATAGSYTGELAVTVTRYEQVWEGDVSSDWSEPGNWHRGIVPTAGDSARVPVVEGGNVYPALTGAAEVARLEVEADATMSLGAFNLVVSGDVLTGSSGGITSTTGILRLTGTDRTFEGVLPTTRVQGTYSLSGNASVTWPLQVWGGRVRTSGNTLRVN